VQECILVLGMKCEFCDNEATVHLKQILKDESKELHLCESCAEERGISDPEGFSLSDLLGDQPEQSNEMYLKTPLECKDCGFTLDDLKKVGRLGCSACYQVFQPEVMGMLESMHKDVIHKGRKPEGMFATVQKKVDIEKFKESIQQAVDAENYELAAKLRDELKGMEGEL